MDSHETTTGGRQPAALRPGVRNAPPAWAAALRPTQRRAQANRPPLPRSDRITQVWLEELARPLGPPAR